MIKNHVLKLNQVQYNLRDDSVWLFSYISYECVQWPEAIFAADQVK